MLTSVRERSDDSQCTLTELYNGQFMFQVQLIDNREN